MNKVKKSDTKKILVRNTALPVPKTRLIVEEKPKSDEKKKIESKTVKSKSEKSRPKFNVPELNSTLKIGEKIDKLETLKCQKLEKKAQVAFCEKVTRKVNFPADKPIYKDLISIQVPARTPPLLTSRQPLPQKDKEPLLQNYARPLEVKEQIYIPSVKLEKQSTTQLNNLRLYKIIQMNTP